MCRYDGGLRLDVPVGWWIRLDVPVGWWIRLDVSV